MAHVEALKPEICTLDLNTMYSFGSVVINTPDSLRVMAARIRAAGTAPELEIFNPGMWSWRAISPRKACCPSEISCSSY